MALVHFVVGLVFFLGAQFFANVALSLLGVKVPLALRLGFPTAVAAMSAWFVLRFAISRDRGGAALGFPLRGWVDLVGGFVVGAVLIIAVMVVLILTGAWLADRAADPASTRSLVWAFIGFGLVALGEEVLFRGVFFKAFEEWKGTSVALALTSAFFGLAHLTNPNASWTAAVAIAIEAGLLLGGAYLVNRSLWLPIGVHWAWNFTLGCVFGAPVSGQNLPTLFTGKAGSATWLNGGAWGPEAGLAAFVICTAAGVAFVLIARRRSEWISRSKETAPPTQLPG